MHKLLRAGILITFGLLILCIASGCGDDDSLEEVMDPPQSADDIGPASVTKVVMDPPSPANTDGVVYVFYPDTEFTLTFNEEVVAVTVNGTPATGSGLNWKWTAEFPYLPNGTVMLTIKWTNRDGSGGFATSGPYEIADNGGEPPTITIGTVSDGEVNVDPAVMNAGIRFDFDERITGNIALTDEAGANLNWIANVAGQTATLTAVAGQELVNGTTYKIEIDVQDGAGNLLQTTITFVTKPK